MKNIHKTLFICVLSLFSCQVDPPGQNEQLTDNQSDQEQNSEECETLFARGDDDQSTCFLDDGFNRWGWTIGPLETGEYTFDLYSAAGQCILDNGTMVGTLSVNYNEDTGTSEIEFEMLEDFALSETHLYIGNEPYPTDQNGQLTVAPGQFPDQHELEDADYDSYTVDGLSGPIYVIAHGVVCNDSDDNGGGGLPE